MFREKILADISVAELKDAGVKPPKPPSQKKKGVDRGDDVNMKQYLIPEVCTKAQTTRRLSALTA